MITLLPCPFCGNPPQTKEWHQRGLPAMRIFCDECSAHLYIQGVKDTVIEKWNTRATKRESGWQPIGDEQKGDGSDIGPIIFAGAKGVRPGYVRWCPYKQCWESAYSDGEKGGLPYFPTCIIPPTHYMKLPEIKGEHT